MPVGVVFVGGLVADLDGKEGEGYGNEIESGMRGVRKDAQ